MTKQHKCALALAVLLVCMIGVFSACEPPKTNLEQVASAVSTKQVGLWTGESQEMDVVLTAMQEEEIFLTDGKVGQQVSVTQLSVRPKQVAMLDKSLSYVITGEKGELRGVMEKNRLGVTFVAKIEGLDAIGKPISVTIDDSQTQTQIEWTDRMAGMLDADAALEIAYNTFAEHIDPLLEAGEWNREGYIRMIHDVTQQESGYYWYVSFIADRDDYWAVLIASDSGEVLSKRMHGPQGESQPTVTTPETPPIGQ